jgi:hypothetical protein
MTCARTMLRHSSLALLLSLSLTGCGGGGGGGEATLNTNPSQLPVTDTQPAQQQPSSHTIITGKA